MKLQQDLNMRKSLSESQEKAIRVYSDIRIALFKKNIQIKDIATMLDMSPASVSRTIRGDQQSRKVVEWVKENLGITIPISAPKMRVSGNKQKKKDKYLDPKFKKFFTPKEVAFYYGMSAKYLAQQRCRKVGISYRKLGRKVLYAKEDLENYFKTKTIKIKVM
ncbi:MAG TPA: DNA-binding protein [candidate division Zixibacteria bacterium]|nr:DNA-binding protein [candidate division Zixibacteria bacterium]